MSSDQTALLVSIILNFFGQYWQTFWDGEAAA